jgi:hypothetical protein
MNLVEYGESAVHYVTCTHILTYLWNRLLIEFYLCVYDRVCKVPRVLFNIFVCERERPLPRPSGYEPVLSRCRFARSTCTWTVSNIPRLTKTLHQSQIDLLFSLPVLYTHTYLLTCETDYWSIFIYAYKTGCVKCHVYFSTLILPYDHDLSFFPISIFKSSNIHK